MGKKGKRKRVGPLWKARAIPYPRRDLLDRMQDWQLREAWLNEPTVKASAIAEIALSQGYSYEVVMAFVKEMGRRRK